MNTSSNMTQATQATKAPEAVRETATELTNIEGQIKHFLKNKGDHNFVWNRDFLWNAIDYLYKNRRIVQEKLKAVEEELVTTRDMALRVALQNSQGSWGERIATALIAGSIGFALGIWLF